MTAPARRLATAADLAALPGDVAAEVIGGEIVEKAAPAAPHGLAQANLTADLVGGYGRRTGGPGGWWILTEVEIEIETHEVYRPDLSGWKRERLPELPKRRPVRVLPDWVCEILSPSNARNDLVTKLRTYHRAGVRHYWIVDPEQATLTVHRWQAEGYLVALAATAGETVRAEPFAEIELNVGRVFGQEG